MNCDLFVSERSESEKHPGETLNIKGYVYPSKDMVHWKMFFR